MKNLSDEPTRRGPAPFGRRALLSLPLLSLSCHSTEKQDRPLSSSKEPKLKRRIVSLSPGITQSLRRLGAGDELVGLSDYCTQTGSQPLPLVGTALTPHYEAIARLRPDLILATQVGGNQLQPLSRLARTVALPWLHLPEVESSLVALGALVNRKARAEKIARSLVATLSEGAPEGAPRVLWTLDLGEPSGNETWYIRDDSMHGGVLRAAGARNAVDKRIQGPPKLSAEELLKVNPEAILMVISRPALAPFELDQARKQLITHFSRWTPLRAVREQNFAVVHHAYAMNLGPAVVDLIPKLRPAIEGFRSSSRPTKDAAP